jgi:hypothetical protein
VSDRKEGAVQVCRIRDLTLLTGYRLGIFWCHFWWHLDCHFQANCGFSWRAEFVISR